MYGNGTKKRTPNHLVKWHRFIHSAIWGPWWLRYELLLLGTLSLPYSPESYIATDTCWRNRILPWESNPIKAHPAIIMTTTQNYRRWARHLLVASSQLLPASGDRMNQTPDYFIKWRRRSHFNIWGPSWLQCKLLLLLTMSKGSKWCQMSTSIPQQPTNTDGDAFMPANWNSNERTQTGWKRTKETEIQT